MGSLGTSLELICRFSKRLRTFVQFGPVPVSGVNSAVPTGASSIAAIGCKATNNNPMNSIQLPMPAARSSYIARNDGQTIRMMLLPMVILLLLCIVLWLERIRNTKFQSAVDPVEVCVYILHNWIKTGQKFNPKKELLVAMTTKQRYTTLSLCIMHDDRECLSECMNVWSHIYGSYGARLSVFYQVFRLSIKK